MKTKEFKKMIGRRKLESDGFTPPYGCIQDGSSHRSGNRVSVKRDRRALKRRVRNQELRQVERDI